MRSYYKLFVDDINFPGYISDQPVNDGDVAIALERHHKALFITTVNAVLPASLQSNYPGWRQWKGYDAFGNYVGPNIDAITLALAGFRVIPYSQHPLD